MASNSYLESGNESDIDMAVQYARAAVDMAAGNERHIDMAVQDARVSLGVADGGPPIMPYCLNNLGLMLEARYERFGRVDDLHEAIHVAQQALDLLDPDSSEYAAHLNGLGSKLERRFDQAAKVADLEEAIRVTRRAVDSTGADDGDRALWLANLGNQLKKWYGLTGNGADLDEAVTVARQAVDLIADAHVDSHVACLTCLGSNLETRYQRTGDLSDLDEAIAIARQVVNLTAEEDDDRALHLSNLANRLESRYEREGEMATLEEAILVARQAVDWGPGDDPSHASRVNDLASMLQNLYDRTGKVADAEEAVAVSQQAVQLMPADAPQLLTPLNNLGASLELRYEALEDVADLERAIAIARQVLTLADDSPDRPAFLNNLGNKLEVWCQHTDEPAVLEEAIAVSREAVHLTPEDQPDYAAWLINLGVKLEIRCERTGEPADGEEAATCFEEAWNCLAAIPLHRIKAAARCLKLLATQGQVDRAIRLGKDVVDLLPTVNTRLLDRGDQQFVMSTFSGVAAHLCAMLLESNQPEQALQWLEKGRAAIIGQIIDNRSDVSDLARHHPKIAGRYQQLLHDANTPLRGLEPGPMRNQLVNQRRAAVAELDACIRDIRTMPGHQRFLLGQTIAEMQECAAAGCIVVVNVTDTRSDAILVSRRVVKAMKLTALSASDLRTWLSKDWTGRRERGKKNDEYLAYLSWLWDAGVAQILEQVRAICDAPEHGGLPRLWWIGSGLASSLPLHAAGMHSTNSTANAYSQVISSYTPSIKALAYSRSRAERVQDTRGPLLIATMPTTPGLRKLPGVIEEKECVLGAVDGHLPVNVLEMASANNVIAQLQRCSISHFACHGTTNHSDPSSSGLVFRKGHGDDWAQDRLTVYKLSELSLEHGRLAYLSACSTAQIKAAQLTDEVIHVVSGFQVAGFPHTVGCLWPSVDRVCVDVARGFYHSLLGRGGLGWRDADVALALNEALAAVRCTDSDMPLNWAQFVHYGA
ncbi:hypothetical protein HIM_06575 [Hirsutella minnesotensis 3608]|uniref:CHAT domain-containing protein n=1 Tax=Hirsutella minnesotensis 3608 TaxID=1043627 RepID=A0A0F7ZJ17_9HYPO|nr:hypothetical protein HIM_06575 [Hirsutella minnesotensis 3608]